MATREITNVTLEAAENGGFLLRYQSKITPLKPSPYNTVDYKYCTDAYSKGDADKAFMEFKRLAGILEDEGEENESPSEERSEY